MGAHGYNTLWLAEHHFQHEGYECLPNDVHLSNSMGTPRDVVLEQLAWLGKEVMPAFGEMMEARRQIVLTGC